MCWGHMLREERHGSGDMSIAVLADPSDSSCVPAGDHPSRLVYGTTVARHTR